MSLFAKRCDVFANLQKYLLNALRFLEIRVIAGVGHLNVSPLLQYIASTFWDYRQGSTSLSFPELQSGKASLVQLRTYCVDQDHRPVLVGVYQRCL